MATSTVPSYYFRMADGSLPVPAFRELLPGDPIQQIVLRVVVELPDGQIHAIGSAAVIAGYLAVTATHVWKDIERFGPDRVPKLLQVSPGPVFTFWKVSNAWPTFSDITILHLTFDSGSEPNAPIDWKPLFFRASSPSLGEIVHAVGFRKSQIDVFEKPGGGRHIEFRDFGATSSGKVEEIFPDGRDRTFLPFPCFRVCARIPFGMSGGIVVDSKGALCGVACSGFDFGDDSNELPIGHATMLWPILKATISANRGDAYPRGVEYQVIELALAGVIRVIDFETLDPRHFPDRDPSKKSPPSTVKPR
jgi:hypothetical protein